MDDDTRLRNDIAIALLAASASLEGIAWEKAREIAIKQANLFVTELLNDDDFQP